MGKWVIVIQGTGSHHNRKPDDADVIAKRCVEALSKASQHIESATFTVGNSEDIELPEEG